MFVGSMRCSRPGQGTQGKPTSTPPSSTAGASSDLDDETCFGVTVYMSMEGKAIPLAHRPCSESTYGECVLLSEDAHASHLPDICRDTGDAPVQAAP